MNSTLFYILIAYSQSFAFYIFVFKAPKADGYRPIPISTWLLLKEIQSPLRLSILLFKNKKWIPKTLRLEIIISRGEIILPENRWGIHEGHMTYISRFTTHDSSHTIHKIYIAQRRRDATF
jgi:hypothetical protein